MGYYLCGVPTGSKIRCAHKLLDGLPERQVLRLVDRRLRERRGIRDRLPIRQRRLIVAERKALGDLHIG